MTRSTFLKTTMTAAGLTATASAAETGEREYVEIRKITLKSPEKQALLESPNLSDRARLLMTLIEMNVAGSAGSEGTMQ